MKNNSKINLHMKLLVCCSHLDSKTGPGLGTSGYYCPQCNSKYCELPVECKVCGKRNYKYIVQNLQLVIFKYLMLAVFV